MEDAAGDVEAGGQSIRYLVRRTLHQRIALGFFNRPSHTEFLTLPFGAIWPDMIYFIMFLFITVQNESMTLGLFLELVKMPVLGFSSDMPNHAAMRDFICKLFEHPVVHVVRIAMHSLTVWAAVFGLIVIKSGLKLSAITAFLWGWLGHVVTDFLTHVTDALPIFWPVSSITIPGPISYWDSRYEGREFGAVNAVLLLLAAIYLFLEAWKSKKARDKARPLQGNHSSK